MFLNVRPKVRRSHLGLPKVSISDTMIDEVAMLAIIQLVMEENPCQILDFGRSYIDNQSFRLLIDCLRNNHHLQFLSLYSIPLNSYVVYHLSSVLSLNNCHLKWLDLESTNLNDTTVDYLAQVLSLIHISEPTRRS